MKSHSQEWNLINIKNNQNKKNQIYKKSQIIKFKLTNKKQKI